MSRGHHLLRAGIAAAVAAGGGGGGGGWDIANASYDSVSKLVSGEDTAPAGLAFKPDGTKMYMVGTTNDRVYQYSLSTAWDVSTATYDSVFESVLSQDNIPNEIAFSSDGTKMYIAGNQNNSVFQYTLSTAWDLSTASYASKSKSVGTESDAPTGLTFKSDGTKMYVVDFFNSGTVYQYSLSTAWDVSTATYDSKSVTGVGQTSFSPQIAFNDDGTRMVALSNDDNVYQYTLSTAWDISTATYDTVSFDISGQETAPTGLAFKPDGTKMYVVGTTNDTVYQYST